MMLGLHHCEGVAHHYAQMRLEEREVSPISSAGVWTWLDLSSSSASFSSTFVSAPQQWAFERIDNLFARVFWEAA